ncbi:MAG: hypothetical protein ACOY3Z_04330 [Thermodesulfobacteriota bacterium]
MRQSLWRLFALGALLLLVLQVGGCATVPATVAVGDQEGERVAALFRQTLAAQRQCPGGLDAQVRVNLRSIWRSGSLQGFVQAMAPSSLKFVGVNPIGQPMIILATDGALFRAVVVPESAWYEGRVDAADFRKYAPADLDPARGFFWLTGRLAPEGLRIEAVEKDAQGTAHWLTCSYPGEEVRQRVLFDPDTRLIRRHLVIGVNGRVAVDVGYDGHLPAGSGQPEACRLPGVVRVESAAHAGATLEMVLGDWLAEPGLTALDFNVPVPPGFVRKPIE